MSTTADFADFILSTTQAYLRGPKVVIREAVENTYLYGDLMVGAGYRDILQGGSKISDSLTLIDSGVAELYGQGDDEFSWKNPQTLVGWDVEWRFALTHFAWTDHERGLQGTGDMTQRARFKKFKDIYDNKVGQAYLSLYNLLESLLWAQPDTSKMEAAAGRNPYSIPAFVNEFSNGLYPSYSPGGAWTAVEGIAPATAGNERWVPAQEAYSNATAGDASNLFTAFDLMSLALTYRPFRGGRDYFERSMKDRKMICCSRRGMKVVKGLMRNSQDLFLGNRQDADWNYPMQAGVPIMYCSALDSAALYPNAGGTALVTEANADNQGGRYYFLDSKYLRPVFHKDRFIKQHTVKEHPNQPFTKVVPIDVWYNVVCRSRQRMGMVYPDADITGF